MLLCTRTHRERREHKRRSFLSRLSVLPPQPFPSPVLVIWAQCPRHYPSPPRPGLYSRGIPPFPLYSIPASSSSESVEISLQRRPTPSCCRDYGLSYRLCAALCFAGVLSAVCVHVTCLPSSSSASPAPLAPIFPSSEAGGCGALPQPWKGGLVCAQGGCGRSKE